jgi:hypothetical protein
VLVAVQTGESGDGAQLTGTRAKHDHGGGGEHQTEGEAGTLGGVCYYFLITGGGVVRAERNNNNDNKREREKRRRKEEGGGFRTSPR